MSNTKFDFDALSPEEQKALALRLLATLLDIDVPAKEAADPKPVDDPKTCVSMKADGTPCMAKPLKGNLVCRHHKVVEPDLPTKKGAELKARSSKAKKPVIDSAKALRAAKPNPKDGETYTFVSTGVSTLGNTYTYTAKGGIWTMTDMVKAS